MIYPYPQADHAFAALGGTYTPRIRRFSLAAHHQDAQPVSTPACPGGHISTEDATAEWRNRVGLSGDWEALIENSGPMASFGTYPNVYRITQSGSAFTAIRLKDTPPPSSARAGSQSLLGELDKGGFKRVEVVTTTGARAPIKGQIGEDGKKIIIDDGWSVKITLTRP